MNVGTVSVWYDRGWARDTHAGTGPWTVEVQQGRRSDSVDSFRGRGAVEKCAREHAARLLGVRDLRGLSRAPTAQGEIVYAPGADDYNGDVVELEWR